MDDIPKGRNAWGLITGGPGAQGYHYIWLLHGRPDVAALPQSEFDWIVVFEAAILECA